MTRASRTPRGTTGHSASGNASQHRPLSASLPHRGRPPPRTTRWLEDPNRADRAFEATWAIDQNPRGLPSGALGCGSCRAPHRTRAGRWRHPANNPIPCASPVTLCEQSPDFEHQDRPPNSGPNYSSGFKERHIFCLIFQRLDGGCRRTRTFDPLIKSQLLYQLSYTPAASRRQGEEPTEAGPPWAAPSNTGECGCPALVPGDSGHACQGSFGGGVRTGRSSNAGTSGGRSSSRRETSAMARSSCGSRPAA